MSGRLFLMGSAMVMDGLLSALVRGLCGRVRDGEELRGSTRNAMDAEKVFRVESLELWDVLEVANLWKGGKWKVEEA